MKMNGNKEQKYRNTGQGLGKEAVNWETKWWN